MSSNAGGFSPGVMPGTGSSLGFSRQWTMYTQTGIPGITGGYAYLPGSGMCQFMDQLNNTMANASLLGQTPGVTQPGGMPGGTSFNGGTSPFGMTPSFGMPGGVPGGTSFNGGTSPFGMTPSFGMPGGVPGGTSFNGGTSPFGMTPPFGMSGVMPGGTSFNGGTSPFVMTPSFGMSGGVPGVMPGGGGPQNVMPQILPYYPQDTLRNTGGMLLQIITGLFGTFLDWFGGSGKQPGVM